MTPLAKSQNLAARMGRWSAGHRKTAIFGWLAFVAVAIAIGSVIGTKNLDPADAEAGESGRALAMIDRAGFDDTVDESVFVQSESLKASSPEFVADVVARLSATEGVSEIRSPLDDPTLVSPDGTAVLVQYELSDTGVAAVDRVGPILDSVAEAQAANPGFTIAGFGSASGENSVDETIADDFQRAEFTAVPLTLGILVLVFGAAVAAGCWRSPASSSRWTRPPPRSSCSSASPSASTTRSSTSSANGRSERRGRGLRPRSRPPRRPQAGPS